MAAEQMYHIPLRYRKMENLHIVFWLLKDISWCLIWKPLGIVMIFPTLIMAVVITVRNRQHVSELCHNSAIVVWILANSYWMVSEFLHFDARMVAPGIDYKHLAVIPFVTGLLILAFYYLWYAPRHKDEEAVLQQEPA